MHCHPKWGLSLFHYIKQNACFIKYLLNIVLWNVNNAGIFTDHAFAHRYRNKGQYYTCESDIAMRQYKLLPSYVTIRQII